jgi:hypothetical protein
VRLCGFEDAQQGHGTACLTAMIAVWALRSATGRLSAGQIVHLGPCLVEAAEMREFGCAPCRPAWPLVSAASRSVELVGRGRFPIKAVADTLGVARSNLVEAATKPGSALKGRSTWSFFTRAVTAGLTKGRRRSSFSCQPSYLGNVGRNSLWALWTWSSFRR